MSFELRRASVPALSCQLLAGHRDRGHNSQLGPKCPSHGEGLCFLDRSESCREPSLIPFDFESDTRAKTSNHTRFQARIQMKRPLTLRACSSSRPPSSPAQRTLSRRVGAGSCPSRSCRHKRTASGQLMRPRAELSESAIDLGIDSTTKTRSGILNFASLGARAFWMSEMEGLEEESFGTIAAK